MRMPERVTEKWSANLHHRKPEGSAARMIRGGLVGPKGRAHARTDGQQVDNPVPVRNRLTDAGRGRIDPAARRAPSKLVGSSGLDPGAMTERRVRAGRATDTARGLSLNRRETPAAGGGVVTVPQTDTGRLAEQAKVDE